MTTDSPIVAITRKVVKVSDLTDEDFAIAVRSKARMQMLEYDHNDHDDMMMLAMYRSTGMPKAGLAHGVGDIQDTLMERMQANFERAGLAEAGVKLN